MQIINISLITNKMKLKKLSISLALCAILLLTGCNYYYANWEEVTPEDQKENEVSQLEEVEQIEPVQEKREPIPETISTVKSQNDEKEWEARSVLDRYTDYKGTAVLYGWMEDQVYYGNEPATPHFFVSDMSLKYLPKDVTKRYYRLTITDDLSKSNVAISQNILDELKIYNKDNPAKIEVDEISFSSEGTPRMNMTRIMK